MGATQIIFWLLSLLVMVGAFGVIISKKPVNSVLWMILVCFALSGHYILMNAQFLAIVNLIVCAGALMALFLFVILMLRLNERSESAKPIYLKLAGMLSALVLLMLLVVAVSHAETGHILLRKGTAVGLTENLGRLLFHKYLIPFEVSSILLLSAIVGIVIIMKKDTIKE